MDDYKEHLRRLALHDDALVDLITADCERIRGVGPRRAVGGTRARRGDHRRRRGALLLSSMP